MLPSYRTVLPPCLCPTEALGSRGYSERQLVERVFLQSSNKALLRLAGRGGETAAAS